MHLMYLFALSLAPLSLFLQVRGSRCWVRRSGAANPTRHGLGMVGGGGGGEGAGSFPSHHFPAADTPPAKRFKPALLQAPRAGTKARMKICGLEQST